MTSPPSHADHPVTVSDTAGNRRLITVTDRNSRRIAGVVHLPADGGRANTLAVLIHGWSGDRCGPAELLCELADHLAARGIPAVRFDFLSRGDSDDYPGVFGLDEMIENTVDVLKTLRNDYGDHAVHLIGICSGGNVALGVAARKTHRVRSVTGLSVLPFQEHAGSAMRAVRRTRHIGAVLTRLLKWRTWRKVFSGAVDYRQVIRGFSGKEPATTTGTDSGRNPKKASWDILGALAGFDGTCTLVYGDQDAEGTRARETFSRVWPGEARPPAFETVRDSNHNFYSLAAKAAVFRIVCSHIIDGH